MWQFLFFKRRGKKLDTRKNNILKNRPIWWRFSGTPGRALSRPDIICQFFLWWRFFRQSDGQNCRPEEPTELATRAQVGCEL
jgi:hypothetical protein